MAYEASSYGAAQQLGSLHGTQKQLKASPSRGLNLMAAFMALLVPWLIFCVTFGTLSFSLRYEEPRQAYCVALATLCCTGSLGYSAFLHAQRKADGDTSAEPAWFVFIFANALVAWFGGYICSHHNFVDNMRPYYDVQKLNVYSEVDPATSRGNEMMDAGQVVFTTGSHLDLSKTMGFTNMKVYCVAPIVGPSSTDEGQPTYDFWAIGLDCCSSNVGDYHCGEFNNPFARGGLRLMNDAHRAFFRLAVQQAEAAYNIRANHPLFFYWMQDTSDEIDLYQSLGYLNFKYGVFVAFILQFFLVLVALVACH